jgi:hypothetical protein
MPVVQTPVDQGNSKQAIDFPFRPGDSVVRLSYHLPYPADQANLRFMSYYSADRLAVFAPPSVHIAGAGFTPGGETQGFSVYMRESVAAKTPISVSVSGTAPPPAPDNGGATNAANGDASQNPSVNSHADSGEETPVASITTLPARLDSLKWILVGGFAALFVLGLIYVWRQPEAAVVGAPHEMAAPPLPGVAAPPAQAAAGKSSANVDHEVRSSLDQLKDTLFRLELRREAGTIAEDDYVRERDRVQKTLRDLVKG